MRAGRWQRIAASWAMRSQPYAAVGTELPVRFDLALAIVTFLDELMKLFTELQECGVNLALLCLLALLRVIHYWPPLSHHSSRHSSLRLRISQESINLRPAWERVLRPTLGARQTCCSVRKTHGPGERISLSQRHRERSVKGIASSRRIDDGDGKRRAMHHVIKCTHQGSLYTKREDDDTWPPCQQRACHIVGIAQRGERQTANLGCFDLIGR